MGKTVATLTVLEDLFMASSETQPALVLAPSRVRTPDGDWLGQEYTKGFSIVPTWQVGTK